MKNIYISILGAFFFLLFLQVNAQDTLRIHITNKHYLDAEGRSSGYRVITQQFHTPDGVLFRQINYDETTLNIDSYIFMFYRDNRLFTEELHNAKDSLQYIIKHDYDARGNEILTQKLTPGIKGLGLTEKTQRKFDQHSRVVLEKKYFGKSAGSTIKYTYTPLGYKLSEVITNKPASKGTFKKETRVYSLDAGNKISLMQANGIDNNGMPYSYSEEYSYTKEGWLASVKKKDADGNVQSEINHTYTQYGNPLTYEERNNKGIVTLKLGFEYRKHFMNIGNQVSHYENL